MHGDPLWIIAIRLTPLCCVAGDGHHNQQTRKTHAPYVYDYDIMKPLLLCLTDEFIMLQRLT
jgi:hypothetical protein